MNILFNRNVKRLSPLACTAEIPDYIESVDTPEQNITLLNLIYAPDEVTGLPKGDIAMFLNEKANAQVKEFISMNLMKENSDSSQGLSFPQEYINKINKYVTDDDIAMYSRDANETPSEYAQRMERVISEQRLKSFYDRAEKTFKKAAELRNKL